MKYRNHSMYLKIGRLLSVTCGMLWVTVSAFSQTTIDSVTGAVQGGTEVVRIELSQALTAVPAGFSIQSPARIALDFPGVANAMGRSTVDFRHEPKRGRNGLMDLQDVLGAAK